MYWTKLFIPTLRESPAAVEGISQQLLLRAGYARQLSPGLTSYLFLGQRVLRKIADIIREEMDAAGAQELLFPALNPTEAAAASIARGELRSYRQLPQIWYQIQTQAEEEPRPRQFILKEGRSFDIDAIGLDISYEKHSRAYRRIFDRCGLKYVFADAPNGHEFLVPSDSGAGAIVQCGCGYAAKLELAMSLPVPPLQPDPAGDLTPEPFHTPNRKTIAEVAEFTGLPETSQMKSLVLLADGAPVLALVRGDHSLSELKLAAATGAKAFRPALPEEIRDWFGAEAGSLGPVGVTKLRVLADLALQGRRNMIAGANRTDYHLSNVTPGEDFEPEYFDLREAVSGDLCARCGEPLQFVKAVQIGHLAKTGGALTVLNQTGVETPVSVGSYSIALERILTSAIELFHDKDGMALPAAIAPFTVVITPVNLNDAAQRNTAHDMYKSCSRAGIDALLDDRDERPGVKFKDADLIGVPYRITLGKKLAQGEVEFVDRRTKHSTAVPVDEAVAYLEQHLVA